MAVVLMADDVNFTRVEHQNYGKGVCLYEVHNFNQQNYSALDSRISCLTLSWFLLGLGRVEDLSSTILCRRKVSVMQELNLHQPKPGSYLIKIF